MARLAERDAQPLYFGLPLTAWIKIGLIALLMMALFRFNLARLWRKTNPFTGQANWEHSMVIPLLGLYYLYVWRDDLLKPKPAEPVRWTLGAVWGFILLVLAIAGLLTVLAIPSLMAAFVTQLRNLQLTLSGSWPVVLPVALAIGAGVFVFVKRHDLEMPRTREALAARWRLMGAWVLAMAVVWGLGFFVSIMSAEIAELTRLVLIGITALSFVAVLVLAKNPALQRVGDVIRRNSSFWFGGFVMLWGILFSFWGIYPGQNDFFKDVGMVIALFGVVTLLTGWPVMRTAWFPIVFLFCAIPWPDQVYSWVAGPLQQLAAKVAVFVLNTTGVPAVLQGTKITIMDEAGIGIARQLNVAEACAGMRSLMTFVSVGAAVAFLSARPLWQKAIIAMSAIPIAIFCNVSRVSIQGLLDRYWSTDVSEGFTHSFTGLVMLVPGFFLILLVAYILDKLFVEVADDPARKGAAANAAAAATANVKRVVRTTPPATTAPAAAAAPAAAQPGAAPARSAAQTASTRVAATPAVAARPAAAANAGASPATAPVRAAPTASRPAAAAPQKPAQPAAPRAAAPAQPAAPARPAAPATARSAPPAKPAAPARPAAAGPPTRAAVGAPQSGAAKPLAAGAGENPAAQKPAPQKPVAQKPAAPKPAAPRPPAPKPQG